MAGSRGWKDAQEGPTPTQPSPSPTAPDSEAHVPLPSLADREGLEGSMKIKTTSPRRQWKVSGSSRPLMEQSEARACQDQVKTTPDIPSNCPTVLWRGPPTPRAAAKSESPEPRRHHAKRKKPDTEGREACDSVHVQCPEPANPQRQKVGSWLPGPARREGGGGLTARGCEASFWGDFFKVLGLDSGGGCTTS